MHCDVQDSAVALETKEPDRLDTILTAGRSAIWQALLCGGIGVAGWVNSRNMWFLWLCGIYLLFTTFFRCFVRPVWIARRSELGEDCAFLEALQQHCDKIRMRFDGWSLVAFSPAFLLVGIGRVWEYQPLSGGAIVACGVAFVCLGGTLVWEGRRSSPAHLVAAVRTRGECRRK